MKKHLLIFSLFFSVGVCAWSYESSAQGPDVDYSKFLHTSQKHASLACNSCHQRTDNSATPKFPGHSACTSCHLGQFTTPAIPMCVICHTDTSGNRPPLKSFPTSFKESFNLKFDHAQHMTGSAKPQAGCNGCHAGLVNRGFGLSIPGNLPAHNTCYACHTPESKAANGREIASCGVCHGEGSYNPTSTNSRVFRFSFSHAKHGTRERLACQDCHVVTAGRPQSRQVSSPSALEHFPVGRVQSCASCHNGKRSFGGDLGFSSCKRCHTGSTFKMPI
ncbi:MAG TPA: cytochrome c3 family protein [Pyrinomonadaceae bacterium]